MFRRSHISFLLAAAAVFGPTAVCLAAEAAAEDHGGGLRENLPVWGLIAFGGFLIALKFLGWDGLTAGMREREANENRLISEAENLRGVAAEGLRKQQGLMQALDERIRETLAEAERDAESTRREIRLAGDREAEISHQRAKQEIARVKNQSLHSIFSSVADRIATEAERRIRESFSAEDQQRLVDESVSEFASRS